MPERARNTVTPYILSLYVKDLEEQEQEGVEDERAAA